MLKKYVNQTCNKNCHPNANISCKHESNIYCSNVVVIKKRYLELQEVTRKEVYPSNCPQPNYSYTAKIEFGHGYAKRKKRSNLSPNIEKSINSQRNHGSNATELLAKGKHKYKSSYKT